MHYSRSTIFETLFQIAWLLFMFKHYAIGGFLRNFKVFRSLYGVWNNGGWKNSTRKVHFLPARGRRKSSRPVCEEVSKRAKQRAEKNVDPKVYMRDFVRECSNILRYSSWDCAQEQLERLHLKWDSYTVNQVLKTHPPMEKAWLFFNWASKLKGFKHDQFTYTTMLDIFGEARRINSMKYVFQQMQEKGITIDAVTYTSLLHWLFNIGDFNGAVKVWEEMKAKHCHPTVVSYTAYMKVLFDNNRAEEATDVYKEMLQSGLSPTCHTYTILMEHLIRSGRCKSALEVFAKMPETGVQPDKATCNILVEQCSKAGEVHAIIQILHYMKEHSFVLRYPVYLQAHETLTMAGENYMLLQQVNPHISIEVFNKSEPLDSEDTASDVNSMADTGLLVELLKKKNFVAIDCIVAGVCHNTSLDPEIVSKIIEANCAHCRIDAALQVLQYSNDIGIHLEQVAYLSLIGVLIRANEFSKMLEVIKQMVRVGYILEPQFVSTLIYRLGHARELDNAVKVFDLLPKEKKGTAVYTALLDACFLARDPDKGIETFKVMKNRGIHSTLGTYNVLIRGLELCGKVDEAKFYRKEKKNWQSKDHGSESVTEEKLCNLLFRGYIVS